MSREPQYLELEGVKVTCVPLPYERAEDILPEVAQLITLVMERITSSVSTMPEAQQAVLMAQLKDLKKADVMTLARILAPTISAVADKLGNGGLKHLAPLLMATTQVVMADASGTKATYSLMKPAERGEVFNEHPEAYFPILLFAGKVTFARFFPGSVLAAIPTPKT